ncbi:MAG TPA: DNA-deoxyinosine glycosylase [Campylobacteraceae bacterium]|nr:DNA-deoxyinosine glycosylase [Campylobacteraceae bacterium]
MRYEHPFDPILFPDTETLILGTFPSLDSFKYDFYYAHKRNQFWKILHDLYGMPTETKEEQIALLKKAKIGLYDIVASCERQNSSDANLKNCTLTDIPKILKNNPSIKLIAFTGKKAAQLYAKAYRDLPIPTVTPPSPSPAYASMRYETKREMYAKYLKKK